MTTIWDIEFLKAREDDAHVAAQQARFEEDWRSAAAQVKREMSDVIGGFRSCPLAMCRRARRCSGDEPFCVTRCGAALPPGVERTLVEQVYAEIQDARREAAEEEAAEKL